MTPLLLLLLPWPPPAAAQVIAPGSYAAHYCRLRRHGMREAPAMRTATRLALIPGIRPKTVDVLGMAIRLDVVASQATALERCPDL